MHVEPLSPRFQYEMTAGGVRATIPARRNWFVLIFMLAWLGGWVTGEVSVARELLSPDAAHSEPRAFLMFWLAGWTVGGAFAIGVVLWQLAGKEIITVNAVSFEHRVAALGIGRTRSFGITEVKDLRAVPHAASPFGSQQSWFPPVFGSGAGSVAFDYGARTYRIAPSLEEAEAKVLVSQLASVLPRSRA